MLKCRRHCPPCKKDIGQTGVLDASHMALLEDTVALLGIEFLRACWEPSLSRQADIIAWTCNDLGSARLMKNGWPCQIEPPCQTAILNALAVDATSSGGSQ